MGKFVLRRIIFAQPKLVAKMRFMNLFYNKRGFSYRYIYGIKLVTKYYLPLFAYFKAEKIND